MDKKQQKKKNMAHQCGFAWMNLLFTAWMWWQSAELSFWVSHQQGSAVALDSKGWAAGAAAISSSCSCLLLAALLKEVGVTGGRKGRGADWHMLPPNKDYSKHLFTNSMLCLMCARERWSTYVVISRPYSPQYSVLFSGIMTAVERMECSQWSQLAYGARK